MAKKKSKKADVRKETQKKDFLKDNYSESLILMLKVQNKLTLSKGIDNRGWQRRLMMVISALLDVFDKEHIAEWLFKPTQFFDGLPPIDLVNSEFATRTLLMKIKLIKSGEYCGE